MKYIEWQISTKPKREFFLAGYHIQVCTDVRNSLKAKTVVEMMCCKQWIREGVSKR